MMCENNVIELKSFRPETRWEEELRREARRLGMETLREAAAKKVLYGETSAEEMLFTTLAE